MANRKKAKQTHHGAASAAGMWDDTALIQAWDDAVREYEVRFSMLSTLPHTTLHHTTHWSEGEINANYEADGDSVSFVAVLYSRCIIACRRAERMSRM